MYLKSCCTLFLLALVACQAAPSSQAIEKSINEAEMNVELEGTSAEKDRAKKSATTFCVEVRSGKAEKIPCTQEVRPQGIVQQKTSDPVVIVQPISMPASLPVPVPTVLEHPKQPIVIQQQQPLQYQPLPQFQPQFVPQPAPQFVAPVPTPAPAKSPALAPASVPIIDIVPPTPTSAPCDKSTIVQPEQSHHTVHIIHSQPTLPSIQEAKLYKIERPLFRPISQQSIVQLPTVCKKCNKLMPPLYPPKFPPGAYSLPYPTTFTDVLSQYEQRTDNCEVDECNCRPEDHIVEISPHKIRINDPRMAHPDGATFDSIDTVPFNSIPYRSSMISTEHDPSISNFISDQSMFFASKGAREAERKHHTKHYLPVNFNVEFPVVYGTDDTHHSQPQYYPSYANPNSYTYPNSYNYGTYGTSYPVSYDSLASANNVPAVTVNAGGPFYSPREFQHTDSSSQPNNEAQPRAFSTNIQSNHEQKEITQTDKESIIKEIIPDVVTMK